MGLSVFHAWPKMHLPEVQPLWIKMVRMRLHGKILALLCLLTALAGCAALQPQLSVAPPRLSSVEAARVGIAVESKLMQRLGGPYYDRQLGADLNRMAKDHAREGRPLLIAVADRSAPALYPLPGNRVVMTRGLLAEVRSRAELESLLAGAAQLAGQVYQTPTSRRMAEATARLLAATDSSYDPAAAAIVLARLFEQAACEGACLTSLPAVAGLSGAAAGDRLPESLERLAALQPGYELLASARRLERGDDASPAIAGYLQAASRSPDEPAILAALGLAYLRAGQVQSARLHLQKAVELQPGYYRTLMGLGYLFLQQGKLREANQRLADSVALLAVPENLFLLAEAREKSGASEEARALYRLVAGADEAGKLGRTAAERLQQAGEGQ